ncbi:hypothetical protein GLOTRDRAFT_80112 [Gloeophyllum trabeum ATCC 11539]|uniref:BTB domain-containing protein n=1 Tax=Gloeophyllum trabeum (strain ATCC 11539 / FP-39264 / Madison 617) TaxID=670483 RepID=S7Q028_GLOTA|nr:uncharacterized protein GLOTRDRAFT_80112 [Gloeophyllum trabeum ATCC 11539]EPQ52882.1 hypothetical protein GLOTRDRAFT_80112 [Gloeophyllum trabeum ATCC 11539]
MGDDAHTSNSEVGEGLTISVSTAFYPGAAVDPLPPDLILASADSVFFYVHSNRLLRCSQNGFNASLPIPLTEMYTGDCPILAATETSTVLNIVLHAIYDLPFEQYSPTSECLVGAVQSLHKYGAVLKQLVVPSTPLYQHLMSVAPLNPIDIYTIAAQFELEELAVATSSHLLSFSLSSISDEMAIRMGPLYLKRLFFLHLGRLDALKRILLPPPPPHPPTNACNFADQKQMVRVWALAVAYLAWDARPDLPITTIKQTLNPLIEKLPCNVCRSSLFDRTKNMIIQWSRVKNTI